MGGPQFHAVLDDLLQLVLLGVAGQQSDLHAGFGGAGIARLHPEPVSYTHLGMIQ